MPTGLSNFVINARAALKSDAKALRKVYVSELRGSHDGKTLAAYVADRAPLFYRKVQNIVDRLSEGYFITAFRETLAKLPTSDSFRSSHFGEIMAGIFAEEVLGLTRLYSKLSLLTAENANAYKMDLVFCNLKTDPIEFVFGEVKSSPKTAADGLPAGHDKSCYASIFTSMNDYLETDLEFDLTAVRDNLDSFDAPNQQRIREALKPYTGTIVRYAAFAIIDLSTKDDSEAGVLATRKNDKEFEVDVVCVEEYAGVADLIYDKLNKLRQQAE